MPRLRRHSSLLTMKLLAGVGGTAGGGGSGPRPEGKIVLHTTLGDIDLSFYKREAPLACRNFIQHCVDGYYDGCRFFRVIRNFMVQCGDPTNSGRGGQSIYDGKPFKDEITPRLRFSRRGLLACANENAADSNHSQWFLTLGDCEHLNGKNTIFGTVTGNTLFNLLRIGQLETDKNDNPTANVILSKVTVIDNPFPDMTARVISSSSTSSTDEGAARRRKKRKRKAVNNQNLLSFGEEEEGGGNAREIQESRSTSRADNKKKDKKKRKDEKERKRKEKREKKYKKKKKKKHKKKSREETPSSPSVGPLEASVVSAEEMKIESGKTKLIPENEQTNSKINSEAKDKETTMAAAALQARDRDREKRKKERAKRAEEKLKKLERFRSKLKSRMTVSSLSSSSSSSASPSTSSGSSSWMTGKLVFKTEEEDEG